MDLLAPFGGGPVFFLVCRHSGNFSSLDGRIGILCAQLARLRKGPEHVSKLSDDKLDAGVAEDLWGCVVLILEIKEKL